MAIIGTVYKIIDNTNGNIYVGSTMGTLKQRMHSHKTNYKRYMNGKSKGKCKAYEIIQNDDYEWEIIEEIDDCDNNKLTERETYYIKTIDKVINKAIPNIGLKINKTGNKDDMVAFHKEYHKEYNKEYKRKKEMKEIKIDVFNDKSNSKSNDNI